MTLQIILIVATSFLLTKMSPGALESDKIGKIWRLIEYFVFASKTDGPDFCLKTGVHIIYLYDVF